MAPLPVITNVFRCALEWQGGGGQSAVNILHIGNDTDDESGVFADLDAAVNSTLWRNTCSTAAITRVVIWDLSGSTAGQVFTPTGGDWEGGSSGTEWAPAVAQLVSLRTAVRGSRGRGRIYLPFISEGGVADGFISDVGVLAEQQAAWDTFVDDLAAAGSQLQVASYAHESSNVVTGVNVEAILATQRRRQSRLR